jgi:hypothetical protein
MSFIKLVFKPGINRDQTNYSGEGGWSDCDKVRFFSGFPQKLGGWQKTTVNTFIGVCRQVWNWITSFTDNFSGSVPTSSSILRWVGSFTTSRLYGLLWLRPTPTTALILQTALQQSILTSLGTAACLETM